MACSDLYLKEEQLSRLETEQDLGSRRRILGFSLFIMDFTQDELDSLKNYIWGSKKP